MAKDLKCPVNAHRHIVGDVRTFRLPAQTKKFFIHEPTDSRRNARRGSRLWRRAFVLGRVCTLSRIDVQSCARNRESRAPAHRFSSRHEFLVGGFREHDGLSAKMEPSRTADSLADEASSAADDVLFKIAPSFPQALIWAETDDPFWYGVKSGERIPVRDIDFLRDWLKLPERPDRPWPQDICRFPLIPLRAFAERAREIVRAKDEFEASWQGRRGTSGRARGECETRSSLGAMERTGNARCDDSSENHGGPDRQVRLDRVRILRRRH
jgi:hypothetical protein